MTDVVLGVDVGSSAVKVAAVALDGRLLSTAEVPNPTTRPAPGRAHQSAEDWYQASCRGVRECLAGGSVTPRRVAAVAVDGPAHNVALLDAQDRVLAPVIHWSDTRAAHIAEGLQKTYGALIRRQTLHDAKASWTLAQLRWVTSHQPDLWAEVRRVVVTKDYVRFRLTGVHATESYDALGTQLYDATTEQWSADLLALLDWGDRDLLPVKPADAVVGTVTPAASADCGLPIGTPVAVGTSDTLAESYAVGVTDPGQTLVKLGSSANVLVVADAPGDVAGALTYPHLSSGRWIQVTATSAGAAAARWLRDAVFPEHERTADDLGVPAYALMERMAAAVPAGSDGLLFHPYLNGERAPIDDPKLRAHLLGISSAHTRSHLVRAVMEGVAFSVRHCWLTLADPSPQDGSPLPVSLIGGGARNAVWARIVCDVLGTSLAVTTGPAAAIGSAKLAATAVGGPLTTAGEDGAWGVDRERLDPDPDTRPVYDELMAIYLDAIDAVAPLSHRLSALGGEMTRNASRK